MGRILAAVVFLLQFALCGVASACDIEKPKGEVILVIDGKINACNESREVRLDLAMIEALPRHSIKTQNPWDDGTATYDGVLLRDLMQFVKADGTTAVVAALNDYRADIPLIDMDTYSILLAFRRDGVDLPVRNKGPLFVVFPFSEYPELKTEVRYGQSVWQVNRITLK